MPHRSRAEHEARAAHPQRSHRDSRHKRPGESRSSRATAPSIGSGRDDRHGNKPRHREQIAPRLILKKTGRTKTNSGSGYDERCHPYSDRHGKRLHRSLLRRSSRARSIRSDVTGTSKSATNITYSAADTEYAPHVQMAQQHHGATLDAEDAVTQGAEVRLPPPPTAVIKVSSQLHQPWHKARDPSQQAPRVSSADSQPKEIQIPSPRVSTIEDSRTCSSSVPRESASGCNLGDCT